MGFGSAAGSGITPTPAETTPEKNNSEYGRRPKKAGTHSSTTDLDTYTKHQRLSATNVIPPGNLTPVTAAPAQTPAVTAMTKTKSKFFEEAVEKTGEWVIEESKNDTILFCKCGKICKKEFSMCDECIASGKVHEAGGYLYLKRDQNNLDRYWFQLINKELYCFKNKDDKEHISMMNISGYVVEEEDDLKIDAKYTIYPFSLCARWDRKVLYSLKAEERKLWCESIRNVLCYSDIYKNYDLGVFFLLSMKKGIFGKWKIW